jgi:MFS family permease
MENKLAGLWTWSFINACIANFLMGFSFYLLIPTLPFYIVEQFGAEKSLVGIILSCYVLAALAIRPLSGYLVDSFPRKTVYVLSFILFVSLYFGYLFVASITFLVIIRILQGLTWGIITTSGSTLSIDIMPSARRGEGVGYYGLTTNFSMALGPLVGLFLHDHYPFVVIFYVSIIAGILGLIAALFIKAPVKDKIEHHQTLSLDRFIMLKGIPLGFNCLFISIPYGMLLSFSAMYGKDLHVSNTGMFFTYMAIGIGSSRIFSGKLIDRGKIHFVMMLGLIILAISLMLFSLSEIPTLYFISAFCIGVGYGTIFPAFLFLFINMAHHNQRGTANSTYLTAFDLGVGIGMIAAGKIAQISSLSMAFGFSALLVAIAVIYYWRISRENYDRNKVI